MTGTAVRDRSGIEQLLYLLDDAFGGRGIEEPARTIEHTHDADHAGEISHLRSLLQGDDRWPYVQLGVG